MLESLSIEALAHYTRGMATLFFVLWAMARRTSGRGATDGMPTALSLPSTTTAAMSSIPCILRPSKT